MRSLRAHFPSLHPQELSLPVTYWLFRSGNLAACSAPATCQECTQPLILPASRPQPVLAGPTSLHSTWTGATDPFARDSRSLQILLCDHPSPFLHRVCFRLHEGPSGRGGCHTRLGRVRQIAAAPSRNKQSRWSFHLTSRKDQWCFAGGNLDTGSGAFVWSGPRFGDKSFP